MDKCNFVQLSKHSTMPRPKNKTELVNLGQVYYDKLIKYIQELPEDVKYGEFPKGYMNRNVKDVIAHLHQWHKMLLGWYEIGMKGEKPEIPAPGYSWKTTPVLNRNIWKKFKDEDFDVIMDLFLKSHSKVMTTIESHTNDELFEKKRFKWTGSTSLGAYLISSTSSHYDWAFKLIKKCNKGMLIA